ncbi:MAG: NAD(+) synthase [Conexivisphaerales archaeon]
MVGVDLKKAREKIRDFIKNKVEEAGADGVVVGISGGIDSAVTTFLAVEALGSRRVLGLIMPDSRITPREDIEDSISMAKELGIETKQIDIAAIHTSFMKNLEANKLAEGNLRARIRMSILYYYANTGNRLVMGTGDRSEILLGYFCYDDETKALTDEGFKDYKELKEGDVVYSLDAYGVIHKTRVKMMHVFDYSDYLLHFEGSLVDLAVTPNHRMLLADENRIYFKRAEEVGKKNVIPAVLGSASEQLKLAFSTTRATKMEYAGKVWCPEIPVYNNLAVVRKDKIAFSGNTKYGDGGVDILPIGDLYKTEVRMLGEILGIDRRIITKKSSPRLWEGQLAETELGISYEEADKFFDMYIEEKRDFEQILSELAITRNKADLILQRIKASEHKRKMPEICKLR